MEEKQRPFPIEEPHATPELVKRRERPRFVLPGLLLFTVTILLLAHINIPGYWKPWYVRRPAGMAKSQYCPQVKPMFPSIRSEELSLMDEFLQTSKFRNESIARLSGAVKIPSISYDDLGPIGEDPRWDIFYDFAEYLKQHFPLIHQHLDLEVVNTHGLLYTWKGSEPNLKPTLLMAHQDITPVAESTIPSWSYPPFDGIFDGKFIWGRGSSDCKNLLIAEMEAVELLLSAGFQPKRTILLSFGFDEEVSGSQGAGHLAPFILHRYGKNGVAVIVDEGPGISTVWGAHFATPAVAEKGYMDVDIVVRMPGGHSSIPPAHTGIGVMSELITMIEADPYKPSLDSDNPFLYLMQCGASYAPKFPKRLKELLPKGTQHMCNKKNDKLADEAVKEFPILKYLITTSVAVDVIRGGVKVNALPERTVATVNHRISISEHPTTIKEKLTYLAKQVALKHNLTLYAFSDEKESASSITLRAQDTVLEPAPRTPTEVEPLSVYSIISGTTRALYGENVFMAPGVMTANTDTKHYWDVSRNIFRFGPGWDEDDEGCVFAHFVLALRNEFDSKMLTILIGWATFIPLMRRLV
jgi:Gly-Xaa carboxypeptidase